MSDNKNIPEIEKILLAARPFRYLDIKELTTLITYCPIIHFANGKTVFRQGKKSEGMYVIIEGKALLTAKTLGETDIELAILEEGNFIGEVSLIEKGLCPASGIAKGQLKCLLLPTTYFDMLGLFFPETKYKIMKAITEEVCERLKYWHNYIVTTMKQSHVKTRSLSSQTNKPSTQSEKISIEEAGFTLNELARSSFFHSFSKEEFEEIIKNTELIKTPNNCSLINSGEKNSSFFVILFGAAQSSILENGKVAKLAVLGPMSLFGSIYYIDQTPSLINYTTHERAILLSIPIANLQNLQKNNLPLFYKIYALISESFVALHKSAEKLHIRLHSEVYK